MNIEQIQVTNINPNMRLLSPVPIRLRILRATRLCRPVSSIADATNSPPKSRKLVLLKYLAAISLEEAMPSKGKNIYGSMLVTATGIHSVIKKTANTKRQ